MPVTATTYPDMRDALVAVLDTVTGLRVLDHAPRDLTDLPCVTLGRPTVTRTRALERESAVGKVDVLVTWPAFLHVRLADLEVASEDELAMVGAIQGALDADASLTELTGSSFPQIHTAKLVAAEPADTIDQAQTTFAYALTFEIALVASRT